MKSPRAMKGVMAAFLAAALLLPGVSSAVLLDRVVAVIDREVITWSELYKAMNFEFESQTRGMTPDEKKTYFQRVQADFLDKLITMRLQIEEAKRLGFGVSENEARAAIDNIRGQYDLTMEEFREALRNEGFQFDDYYSRIRDQVLVNKIINSEVRSKIVVSDAEAEEYLSTHRTELALSTMFRMSEIRIKPPEDEGEKDAVNSLIGRIYDRIERDIEFSTIMKNMKKNPLVVSTGETDFINASDLREELFQGIKNLKDGEISRPIHTKEGIFIVKVHRKESKESHEELMSNIRKLLYEKKMEELYFRWVKQLRQRSFIQIKL